LFFRFKTFVSWPSPDLPLLTQPKGLCPMGEQILVKGIVLASSSSFRAQILNALGVPFKAVTSPIDEKTITSPDIKELSIKRAMAKAEALGQFPESTIVIGADQTLSCEGIGFDKAESTQEAFKRLKFLSGRVHYLHSSVCLFGSFHGNLKLLDRQTVDVPMSMRNLSDEEIAAYLETGEWKGVVGCYQAENKGCHLFNPPMGDFSAIMGLPQSELLAMFRRIGVNFLLNPDGPWLLSDCFG
jgi:septum formation protein